ncbi:MAG: glycosyltransferase family 2 protein [Acidimicrobiales bacterium]
MSRDASRRRTEAVGVVVPVHNEQELLAAALESLVGAFDELSPRGLATKMVIVLDACRDASEEIAREWQHVLARERSRVELLVVTCHATNVGYARGLGCSTLLTQWSRLSPAKVWLATTDADSRVPKDWIATQVIQHEAGVDHWSGRVSVTDWSERRYEARQKWLDLYEREGQPIHGASLGFNAAAYLAAGGFQALATGEDRSLHRTFVAQGVRAYYDPATRVITSARRQARAPLGFAHALDVIETSVRLPATG